MGTYTWTPSAYTDSLHKATENEAEIISLQLSPPQQGGDGCKVSAAVSVTAGGRRLQDMKGCIPLPGSKGTNTWTPSAYPDSLLTNGGKIPGPMFWVTTH